MAETSSPISLISSFSLSLFRRRDAKMAMITAETTFPAKLSINRGHKTSLMAENANRRRMMMSKSKSQSKINDWMIQNHSVNQKIFYWPWRAHLEDENSWLMTHADASSTSKKERWNAYPIHLLIQRQRSTTIQYRSIDCDFLGKIGMAYAKIMIHNKLNHQIWQETRCPPDLTTGSPTNCPDAALGLASAIVPFQGAGGDVQSSNIKSLARLSAHIGPAQPHTGLRNGTRRQTLQVCHTRDRGPQTQQPEWDNASE